MINQFIEEGKNLEEARSEEINKAKDSKYATYRVKMLSQSIDSEEFRTWAANVVTYLQKNHPTLAITEDIVNVYPRITATTSKEFYSKTMGVLESLKETEAK